MPVRNLQTIKAPQLSLEAGVANIVPNEPMSIEKPSTILPPNFVDKYPLIIFYSKMNIIEINVFY
jgi:hypothetical protein